MGATQPLNNHGKVDEKSPQPGQPLSSIENNMARVDGNKPNDGKLKIKKVRQVEVVTGENIDQIPLSSQDSINLAGKQVPSTILEGPPNPPKTLPKEQLDAPTSEPANNPGLQDLDISQQPNPSDRQTLQSRRHRKFRPSRLEPC